jgi:UDP-N-acetylmuramyl tripeptide synthase
VNLRPSKEEPRKMLFLSKILDYLRTILAVLIGRLARKAIRIFRSGGGSAFPGIIAERIQPNLLVKAIDSARKGLVVVSGSSGKSSTTQNLVALLRAHGYKIFTNPSTANITQGLFAAILEFGNWRGQIDADFIVMEWDEGHGAKLVESLKPRLAVLTNVYSDQLDRFVDPELVVEKLKKIFDNSEHAVVNVNDKNLTQFVELNRATGFGLASDVKPKPSYAINFGPHPFIDAAVEVTAVGPQSVELKVGNRPITLNSTADAPHQALNLAAAVAALTTLIEPDWDVVERTIAGLPPVFARDEIALVRGKKVRFLLCLNSTSFSLSLSEIDSSTSPLMLMAGSDIRDPSWLWTVDFSKLSHVDIVGGRNAYDLALRLIYQGIIVDKIILEADEAVEAFLSLGGSSPTVLFSADAMRRTRRHLGLAK